MHLRQFPSEEGHDTIYDDVVAKLKTDELVVKAAEKFLPKSRTDLAHQGPTPLTATQRLLSSTRPNDHGMSKVEEEILLYSNLPPMSEQGSASKWWKKNQSALPVLGLLYRKFCARPPAAVASETTFSASGQFITDKRIWLSCEHAEDSVIIDQNLEKVREIQKL